MSCAGAVMVNNGNSSITKMPTFRFMVYLLLIELIWD